jgi:hypothetical protein
MGLTTTSDNVRTPKQLRRFLSFSSMEWGILLMGLIGFLALWISFPHTAWKMYICLFGLGFLFEASMEPLFTYHPQLRERHCIGKTDVNFLFPFAWLCVTGCTTLFTEKIILSNSFFAPIPGYILGGFIAGNLHEIIFFKLHFWNYNYEQAMFGSFKPFVPVITIAGIPVQVIAGYCNIGLMLYFFNRVIFSA